MRVSVGAGKRTSTLEHLLDPTKVLTLRKFDRSTDHDARIELTF